MQSLLTILSHCLFISSLKLNVYFVANALQCLMKRYFLFKFKYLDHDFIRKMHYNAWPNTYNRFSSVQPEAPCCFSLLPIKYVSKLNLRGIYKIIAIIWNKQVRKEKNLLCSCDFATMNESWCKKSFCDKVSASLINCTWSTYLGYHLSSSTPL